VGNVRILDIINTILDGKGRDADYRRMLTLATIMNKTCFCPLGQSPLVPIATALSLGVE
jgi:NADH:ubiquinone oxidoreductase subunit F (NADH-binding)